MRRGRQMALTVGSLLAWSSLAVAAPPQDTGPAPQPTQDAEPAEDAAPPAAQAPPPTPAPAPERDPVAEGDVGFWRAHIGMDIDLVLDDGTRFAGHLLAIEAGQLIAARRSDGTIVVIPAARVAEVSARRPVPQVIRPIEHDRGTGLVAAGATFTALGGFMFIGTLVAGIACRRAPEDEWPYSYRDCSKDYLAYLVPGLIFTGAGVPMIVGGKLRQRRLRDGQVAAGLRIDRHGVGVQIGGRF